MLAIRLPRPLGLLLVLIAALAATAPEARADAELASVFGEGMVLQRGKPIRIWGRAKPAEKVTVTLAGRTATTRASTKGRWKVTLDALEAGGPHTLTVKARNELTLGDILVGEVWVCSGQSNMQWSVRQSADPKREIDMSIDVVKVASGPIIRLCSHRCSVLGWSTKPRPI